MDESKSIEYINSLTEWISSNELLLTIMGITSAIMFIGTITVLGVFIVLLPESYFVKRHRESPRQPISNPILWFFYLVLKNLMGALLILAGVAMLFLPGQGMLSILIGLSLTSFPGKRRLIRYMIGRKTVLKSANWFREKFNRGPLQAPE